jgi:hypothetical protein
MRDAGLSSAPAVAPRRGLDRLSELLDGRGRIVLFLLALAIGLALYAPALGGPPISDDFGLLLNPWVIHPTPENLLALLDPRSEATQSLKNYAPVRPLLNALQWSLHPQVSLAYHALNVALHALATVLLAVFLRSVGVSTVASVLASAVFLVHPANVEAIAWMSQVWNPLALIFSILALLMLRRRPLVATLWLALALLTKPLAVFAVPTAAVLSWCRDGTRDAARPAPENPSARRWAWIACWMLLVLLFAGAQLTAYGEGGGREILHDDPAVVLRSICTYALRYLVMASTSFGVSAFHEPPLSHSWTDPWFLCAVAVLFLIGLRLVATLRARSPEAAGWVWALAAFVPVSQLFPFLYPMSDRYLYFMLPGLLLAACFGGRDLLARCSDANVRVLLVNGFTALVLATCVAFGVRSVDRARIWRSEDAVLMDSARAYPDGVASLVLRARRAASEGDVATTDTLLRRASERGWDWWDHLLTHPAFEPVRGERRFKTLIEDLAGRRIAKSEGRRRLTQMELSSVAEAHALRGETDQATAALDQAIARGGPLDEELRARRARLLRSAKPR